MISFDLECSNKHKFEGIFKDYESFCDQLEKNIIKCPICESSNIKRLFSGCSIQPRPAQTLKKNDSQPGLLEAMKKIRQYVIENFENVGREFPDIARDIHYGVEEKKNIYGEITPEESKELLDEGITILPIPDVEKIEN